MGLCGSSRPKPLSHNLHNWRARVEGGGREEQKGRGKGGEEGRRKEGRKVSVGGRKRRGTGCEDLAHPAARAGDSFESQGVGVGRGTCRRQQKER